MSLIEALHGLTADAGVFHLKDLLCLSMTCRDAYRILHPVYLALVHGPRVMAVVGGGGDGGGDGGGGSEGNEARLDEAESRRMLAVAREGLIGEVYRGLPVDQLPVCQGARVSEVGGAGEWTYDDDRGGPECVPRTIAMLDANNSHRRVGGPRRSDERYILIVRAGEVRVSWRHPDRLRSDVPVISIPSLVRLCYASPAVKGTACPLTGTSGPLNSWWKALHGVAAGYVIGISDSTYGIEQNRKSRERVTAIAFFLRLYAPTPATRRYVPLSCIAEQSYRDTYRTTVAGPAGIKHAIECELVSREDAMGTLAGNRFNVLGRLLQGLLATPTTTPTPREKRCAATRNYCALLPGPSTGSTGSSGSTARIALEALFQRHQCCVGHAATNDEWCSTCEKLFYRTMGAYREWFRSIPLDTDGEGNAVPMSSRLKRLGYFLALLRWAGVRKRDVRGTPTQRAELAGSYRILFDSLPR